MYTHCAGAVSISGADDAQPSTADHGDLFGGEKVIPEAALEAFKAIGQDEAETERIDVSPLDTAAAAAAAASQGVANEASRAEGAPASVEDQKASGDSTGDAMPKEQVDSTAGGVDDESPSSPSAEVEAPATEKARDSVKGSKGAPGQAQTACSSPRSIADTADAFGSQIQTPSTSPGNDPQQINLKSDPANDAKDPKDQEQDVSNSRSAATNQDSKSLMPAEQAVDAPAADSLADGKTGTGPEAKPEDEELSEMELQNEVEKDLMAASQASALEESSNATN